MEEPKHVLLPAAGAPEMELQRMERPLTPHPSLLSPPPKQVKRFFSFYYFLLKIPFLSTKF